MSETLLERIEAVLARAADHDPNAVVAPIAVLWPDESRQWESVIAELRESRPIISLGPFDAAVWQGPAYWIRCVIGSTIDRDGLPHGTPIIYLPGVSRDVIGLEDVAGCAADRRRPIEEITGETKLDAFPIREGDRLRTKHQQESQ